MHEKQEMHIACYIVSQSRLIYRSALSVITNSTKVNTQQGIGLLSTDINNRCIDFQQNTQDPNVGEEMGEDCPVATCSG